jgi:cytoskeletal protein CcmA (bactofilin family)
MDKSAAFILPAGINLDVSQGTFSLRHEGDVVLEQTLGLPIGTIEVDGDLVLTSDQITGDVISGGTLHVTGDVTGEINSGGNTEVSGQVDGTIASGGDVLIRGSLSGSVHSKGHVTVEGGTAEGNITAEGDVSVAGDVNGGSITTAKTLTLNGGVNGTALKASTITLSGSEVSAPSLHCEGQLEISGNISGNIITGQTVILTGDTVVVKAVSATEKVVIGAGHVKVDVVIAPEVEIHEGATGRITVIESKQTSPLGSVKGGFSLDEYEDLFGDAIQFLKDRGVSPLDSNEQTEVQPAQTIVEVTSAPQIDSSEAEAALEEASPLEEETGPEQSVVLEEESLSKTPEVEAVVEYDEEEDEDDVIEIVAAAVVEKEDRNSTSELHPQLLEAIVRITSCYEGAEVPTAVTDLETLVHNKDYDALRTNITDVWNGLLGFHQSKGIRPHHQVTHAFNVIHGLIQKSL